MMRRMAAGAVALAGLVGGTVAALPAHAEEIHPAQFGQALIWRDNGYGGCQKPGSAWGKDGALSALTIADRVTWNTRQYFRVSYSESDATNTGCLNGYAYDGGTKRMGVSWTVNGQKLVSCSIGVGGNCTLSDTKVTDSTTTGTLANNNGQLSIKAGGGSVYAGGETLGKINNYTHTATATFAVGGTQTTASASNYAFSTL